MWAPLPWPHAYWAKPAKPAPEPSLCERVQLALVDAYVRDQLTIHEFEACIEQWLRGHTIVLPGHVYTAQLSALLPASKVYAQVFTPTTNPHP